MSTGGHGHNAFLAKLILATLSILSIYTTFLLYSLVQQIKPNGFSRWHGNLDVAAFTFVGDDFPDYVPIEIDDIQVERGKEWPRISISFNEGDSSYRLGPQNRTFAIAMFHELHCLDSLQGIIVTKKYPPVDVGHVEHCLSFLRQWTLCEPDLTLEPGNFVDQGPSRDLVTSTRICRNWDVLYQHVTENYGLWADFTVMQNWEFTEWYVGSFVISVMQAG